MIDAKMTNRRQHTEWYTCGRCDLGYPRNKVIVQNGLIVCYGPNTHNCMDQPGRNAFMKYPLPQERPLDPLPERFEDI